MNWWYLLEIQMVIKNAKIAFILQLVRLRVSDSRGNASNMNIDINMKLGSCNFGFGFRFLVCCLPTRGVTQPQRLPRSTSRDDQECTQSSAL